MGRRRQLHADGRGRCFRWPQRGGAQLQRHARRHHGGRPAANHQLRVDRRFPRRQRPQQQRGADPVGAAQGRLLHRALRRRRHQHGHRDTRPGRRRCAHRHRHQPRQQQRPGRHAGAGRFDQRHGFRRPRPQRQQWWRATSRRRAAHRRREHHADRQRPLRQPHHPQHRHRRQRQLQLCRPAAIGTGRGLQHHRNPTGGLQQRPDVTAQQRRQRAIGGRHLWRRRTGR